MTFEDMNQTLVPPDGFEFQSAHADGAYLKLIYVHSFWNTPTQRAANLVTIYLNDMGREVARTTDTQFAPIIVEPVPEPLPVARRFRIWNGVLIILEGIQEMLRCLKS